MFMDARHCVEVRVRNFVLVPAGADRAAEHNVGDEWEDAATKDDEPVGGRHGDGEHHWTSGPNLRGDVSRW